MFNYYPWNILVNQSAKNCSNKADVIKHVEYG